MNPKIRSTVRPILAVNQIGLQSKRFSFFGCNTEIESDQSEDEDYSDFIEQLVL